MQITHLRIEGCRNLTAVKLPLLSPRFNCFYGENGSGKTAILEAISFFGFGRSFKQHQHEYVINHSTDKLSLFVESTHSDISSLVRAGFSRHRDGSCKMQLNSEPIDRLSLMTAGFPILFLGHQSFQLLEGSTSYRCQFLDWGVFHVEPDFYAQWKKHKRVVKQRNLLLKEKDTDKQLDSWDGLLIESALAIESYRINYLQQFNAYLQASFNLFKFTELDGITVSYKEPWTQTSHRLDSISTKHINKSVFDAHLKASLLRDKKYARTHIHCGKSDLVFKKDNVIVKHVLSRGQLKKLLFIIKIAQALFMRDELGVSPIFLLDDMDSDFDQQNIALLIDVFSDLGCQLFVTTAGEVVPELINKKYPNECEMFHVKHGKITHSSKKQVDLQE